jgi:hypothetical protein
MNRAPKTPQGLDRRDNHPLLGTCRRDPLDQVIACNERHLNASRVGLSAITTTIERISPPLEDRYRWSENEPGQRSSIRAPGAAGRFGTNDDSTLGVK